MSSTAIWSLRRAFFPGDGRWAIFLDGKPAGLADEPPRELVQFRETLNAENNTTACDFGICDRSALANTQCPTHYKNDQYVDIDSRGRWLVVSGFRHGSGVTPIGFATDTAEEIAPQLAAMLHAH